jgi:outer membrane protein TolC
MRTRNERRRAPVARFAALPVLVLAAGAVMAAPVGAETLEQAWRAALAGDLSLQAAASRVAAAESELAAARADRRPSVSASASALTLNETPAFDFAAAGLPLQLPLFRGSTWVMAGTQVSVPLYTGGATRSSIDAAAANVEAEQHAAGSLLQQVKLGIAERYVAVLRASSAVGVAESDVASLRAHLEDVEDMYRNGSVPRNDFLAASVSLADAEQRQLQAANARDIAEAAYNRALGRDLTAAVNLDETLPQVDRRLGGTDLEAITALAVDHREELDRLEAAEAVLSARSAATEAQRRPQIGLTGGYYRIENDVLNRDDFWTVGVGVQWQLFDSGRRRGRADALALQSAAARDERQDLESIVHLEVRQAWLARGEAERRVGLAAAAVDQADENLRVARDRYRSGEGTNTEVLDAEALRSSSRRNLDSAHYDAALARYRLARAAGLL